MNFSGVRKQRFCTPQYRTSQLVGEIPTPHFYFAILQNPEIASLTINKKFRNSRSSVSELFRFLTKSGRNSFCKKFKNPDFRHSLY
jgi:hypothetical protein